MKICISKISIIFGCILSIHANAQTPSKIDGVLQSCTDVPEKIEVAPTMIKELCFKDKVIEIKAHVSSESYFTIQVDKTIPKNYQDMGIRGVVVISAKIPPSEPYTTNIYITLDNGKRLERILTLTPPGEKKSK